MLGYFTVLTCILYVVEDMERTLIVFVLSFDCRKCNHSNLWLKTNGKINTLNGIESLLLLDTFKQSVDGFHGVRNSCGIGSTKLQWEGSGSRRLCYHSSHCLSGLDYELIVCKYKLQVCFVSTQLPWGLFGHFVLPLTLFHVVRQTHVHIRHYISVGVANARETYGSVHTLSC